MTGSIAKRLAFVFSALLLSASLLAGCGGGGGGGGTSPGFTASSGGDTSPPGDNTPTQTPTPTPTPTAGLVPAPPSPPSLTVPTIDATRQTRTAVKAPPRESVPGELLVKLRPSRKRSLAQIGQRSGLSLSTLRAFPRLGLTHLRIQGGASPEDAARRLSADPDVAYAEPNYVVHADETLATDPSFPSQWGLHNTGQDGGSADADIDAPDAWDVTKGSATVVVAVLDTGVDYTHPDLAANMWANPAEIPNNSIDDDNNGYVDDVHGINVITGSGDPMDDNLHGTHVAGIIAATADNGEGISGAAPGVRIMALKFLDDQGGGNIADAVACIDYALAQGVRISNNSWGGYFESQAIADAIQRAADTGHLFVASAGNGISGFAVDTDQLAHFPSGAPSDNVISVGSSNRIDEASLFSNYGANTVDIFAPGEEIVSTVPGGAYDTLSGTSMASPHVAAVAALVWSNAPSLGMLEVKVRVLAGSEPALGDALDGLCTTGNRLNARLALSAAPTVHLFEVSSAGVSAGMPLVLHGIGFGTHTASAAVRFSGAEAETVLSWTDTRIEVLVPAGAQTGEVSVVRGGGAVSNGILLTVVDVDAYAEEAVTSAFEDIDDIANFVDVFIISDPIAIGFDFTLYGQTHTHVSVATNGEIFLDDGSRIEAFTDPLSLGGALIYVKQQGTAPNRELIVQWNDIPRSDGGPGTVTVQAVLREATQDVVLRYQDTVFGDPAYDGGPGFLKGVMHSSGVVSTLHDAAVADGDALRFFVPSAAAPVDAPESLTLATGFNLVSFPVGQLTALGLGSGIREELVTWDADTQDYVRLAATAEAVNARGTGRAYWVYSDVDQAVLTYEGTAPVALSTVLEPGWNLIGVPSAGQVPLSDLRVQDLETLPAPALATLAASVSAEVTEPSAPLNLFRYAFKHNDTYGFVDLADATRTLVPGQGYWVWSWRQVRLQPPP